MNKILLFFALKYEGDWHKIYEALDKKEKVEPKALEEMEKEFKGKYTTILDKDYPKRLKNIVQPPFVLFYKGKLDLTNKVCSLAVIGSREPSSKGVKATNHLVNKLDEKFIIVSGMAKGIDTTAHLAAIDSKKETIAVLGSGINDIYPACNKDLYQKLTKDYLVLSEYPLNVKPTKESFKARNRIVSGLSDAILVTDAKKRSGTMNTVAHGLGAGKDIFAIPFDYDSKSGCNSLIKQGAKLIETIKDIEEEF